MDLLEQIHDIMTKITTEKPLVLGAILTSGWLVGTLVSSVASSDFTGLLALSQAVLILLESNLIGALWFIGKIAVVYLAIKMIILLFKLCQTGCSKTMIYEFKKMTPFFEQMFVFFFTLLIDSDRLGQRIEEIIEKKASKKFSKQNELIKVYKKKQLTLKLFECVKYMLQQKRKLHAKDIENATLFPNCNSSIQKNLTAQAQLTSQKKIKSHKKRPIIKVILSNATGHEHGEAKRLYVRAVISSSSTCSLITEKMAKELQLVPKSFWPVLVRESISQPIRVCCQSVQVRMEAIKPHEHICHTMEVMLVQKIASCSAKVDLIIGQDLFNWTVNILPVQRTHFLPSGGTQIDTKFGVVNIGERFNEEDKQLNNSIADDQTIQKNLLDKPASTYKTVTLPWREFKDDEENRGCVRDMTLLFTFPLILGLFSYFDLLLLLTLFCTSFVIPIWCIFDRTIFSSPKNHFRKLLHSATENMFIFLYALKLFSLWILNQAYDPKDPVLYKPTLTVRVRSLDTECSCRVLFDTTRAQSYIARSTVQHLGKLAPGKTPGRVQVQMEALHDRSVCNTVELVPSKRLLFADYMPTPSRELREVMSVQHGVRLTDDTPEWQVFGNSDIIVGTELLADCFSLPGQSACIYLAPNLVLTPTLYGYTLAGSHYPLLEKSLHTIFTSHSRVLCYLSHHLIPFVGSCMVSTIVISVLWDSYWYLSLVSDISTFFQYQYKIEYFSNCDNFRGKTDSIYLLNTLYVLPKKASCWLYQNTF